jgi:hypothetical protein
MRKGVESGVDPVVGRDRTKNQGNDVAAAAACWVASESTPVGPLEHRHSHAGGELNSACQFGDAL